MRGEFSFARRLADLSPADLETLLTRRPEAFSLSGKRSGFGALAEVLSKREHVVAAVRALDRFHLQLLHTAVWYGPRSPADALVSESRLDDATMYAGARELARCGLAFPDGAPPGAWAVDVPGGVAQVLPAPPGVGPRAAHLLPTLPVPELLRIASHLGLERPKRPLKGELVRQVAAAMSDPGTVGAVLAAAPTASRRVLDAVREAGGFVAWDEAARAKLIPYSYRGWGEPGPAARWLMERGLLLADATFHWAISSGMAVPAEIETALRGGHLFERWDPQATALDARPCGGAGDPSAILADAEALLDEWALRPPARLQKGGLGVRELRRTTKALGTDERRAQFLYALLAEAQLVQYGGEHVVPAARAREWAGLPPARRWAVLFDAWREAILWDEGAGGLLPVDELHGRQPKPPMRAAVMEALATLPEGCGATVESLGARLAWTLPLGVHCAECGRGLVERIAESLAWLGAATPAPLVALREPARSGLSDPAWTDRPWEAFPPPVEICTVQADLDVIVPGPPSRELAAGLGRFADLQRSSPARVYRITEGSLRRALDGGMRAAEILALLERHAPKGVPQSVAYLVEDVGRRHGRLVAGRAGLYVRSDDPALVAAVAADRKLARLRPRLLAPTVAVVEETSVARLLEHLRKTGYMPVPENGGAGLEQPARPRSTHPIVPRRPAAAMPAHGTKQARRLARALAAGPAPRDEPASGLLDGTMRRTRADVAQLLAAAAEREEAVEILYAGARGDATVRTIEPLGVADGSVHAWCRLRMDERTFRLPGIVWARATGEPFGEESREYG